jgi:hypothetical protein
MHGTTQLLSYGLRIFKSSGRIMVYLIKCNYSADKELSASDRPSARDAAITYNGGMAADQGTASTSGHLHREVKI